MSDQMITSESNKEGLDPISTNLFDDIYINHDLTDWSILLMTITTALLLYSIIFYAIGFVFIHKNKKRNELIDRKNRELFWALYGAKAETIEESQLRTISRRSEHLCRFCDQDSKLETRLLLTTLAKYTLKLFAYICGLIAILINYNKYVFYLLGLIYLVICALAKYYDFQHDHQAINNKSCGFIKICKINDLLVFTLMILSHFLFITYFVIYLFKSNESKNF